ncbi:SMP-30/gluconolactonase/LRE family protein [Candidatus Latescibacterota bacterium]
MTERNHSPIIFVLWSLGLIFLCFSFPLPQCYADSFNTTIPTVVDPRYEIQILVPGSHFHGIHGITFDSEDNLYAGSVFGQSIYTVDVNSGDVREYIGPPLGMADDLEFGPDGRIYYTSFSLGKLHCKSADGKVIELADGLPGINSLAFNHEGRLFASQLFYEDTLCEIDLSGEKKTRMIIEKPGGLNGFDFGPDNKLYGPLQSKGAIGRIDVETGKMEVVAEGLEKPTAVNFDSKGNLFAVCNSPSCEVIRIDVKTGRKTVIAKAANGIDNLAIDSKDRIFINTPSNNGIYEIDKKTGKSRSIVEGKLNLPAGVAVVTGEEGDIVYLSDLASYRKADGFTGEVTTLNKGISFPSGISANDSTVILSSYFRDALEVIDRTTNESRKIISGFTTPTNALLMDDGSLIVAEITTGNLLRVTGEEGKERTVIAQGLNTPVYLARAGNDVVFVTEAIPGTVARINLNTGDKKIIASGLKMPEGVGVLPDGKLIVVETETKQLSRIDPASGTITPIVINLAVGFPDFSGNPHSLITGVAVSNSGTIYVTGDIENVLYKIIPK